MPVQFTLNTVSITKLDEFVKCSDYENVNSVKNEFLEFMRIAFANINQLNGMQFKK